MPTTCLVFALSMFGGCSWEPLLQMPEARPTSKTLHSVRIGSSGERLEVVRHEETKRYTTIDGDFDKVRAVGLEVRLHENESDPAGKSIYRLQRRGKWELETGDDPLARQRFDRSNVVPTGKLFLVDGTIYLFVFDHEECLASIYSSIDERFQATEITKLDRRVLDAAYVYDANDDPSWHFGLLEHAAKFGREKSATSQP